MRLFLTFSLGMLLAGTTAGALWLASQRAQAAGQNTAMAEPADSTAHAFSFTAIDGGPMPMHGFAGKAVLVVNTASLCGFTDQYAGLQSLWERYKDGGLVVLGVPSNDFGGQEPGSEEEIKEFCKVNFAVTFPMTEKYSVRGDGAHPFYQWARAKLGGGNAPKWNFHKYLVRPDGTLAGAFPSTTAPQSSKLIKAIESVLPDNSA